MYVHIRDWCAWANFIPPCVKPSHWIFSNFVSPVLNAVIIKKLNHKSSQLNRFCFKMKSMIFNNPSFLNYFTLFYDICDLEIICIYCTCMVNILDTPAWQRIFLNFAFSGAMLAWNQPKWAYLLRGNKQTLRTRTVFISPGSLFFNT